MGTQVDAQKDKKFKGKNYAPDFWSNHAKRDAIAVKIQELLDAPNKGVTWLEGIPNDVLTQFGYSQYAKRRRALQHRQRAVGNHEFGESILIYGALALLVFFAYWGFRSFSKAQPEPDRFVKKKAPVRIVTDPISL